ncbi:MAG: CRISPR-associated protein Cas5 [Cloacibacillus sp.]
MQKIYEISCEISGPCAMFTRPDTGDVPVSYTVPTASAVRGIFESINWGPAVTIIPQRVEICSPIRFENYITNYGGPLRHSSAISSGSNYQLLATILVDVCYKLYAEARPLACGREKMTDKAKQWDANTTSPGHAYKAIFERRLKRGQLYRMPSLGWNEFAPDYLGPLRSETHRCRDINMVIPSLLMEVFPDGFDSQPRFCFAQNVPIKEGALSYPQREGDSYAQ